MGHGTSKSIKPATPPPQTPPPQDPRPGRTVLSTDSPTKPKQYITDGPPGFLPYDDREEEEQEHLNRDRKDRERLEREQVDKDRLDRARRDKEHLERNREKDVKNAMPPSQTPHLADSTTTFIPISSTTRQTHTDPPKPKFDKEKFKKANKDPPPPQEITPTPHRDQLFLDESDEDFMAEILRETDFVALDRARGVV
ncbi:hypothetical protein SpCBS45565_g00892 [Spizellomyces sp. 'palustris']|nr:hypothetical protein SpCBS45565_g00892 [Spizellomyces sp. 'palustris']